MKVQELPLKGKAYSIPTRKQGRRKSVEKYGEFKQRITLKDRSKLNKNEIILLMSRLLRNPIVPENEKDFIKSIIDYANAGNIPYDSFCHLMSLRWKYKK